VLRIAAVFAHPDDETFAIGGTIAKYASQDATWDLFCATDGDAGRSSGAPVSSRQELAALRRTELVAAARLLGVRGLIVSRGYPDGGLADADPDRLVGDIVEFLREARPDVIITFGPEGGPNAHRDHRAVSRAATAAFFLAASPTAYPESGEPHTPARLFYHTWPPPGPGSPHTVHGSPASARIDVRGHLDVKRRAFTLHATQRELRERFELLALADEEWFALASGKPQSRDTMDDLLEGL
jgi:LmbE family N-acetylglucosaminyl deacetylase